MYPQSRIMWKFKDRRSKYLLLHSSSEISNFIQSSVIIRDYIQHQSLTEKECFRLLKHRNLRVFTHHSDKRDSRNCEDRNAYFLFFPIKVQTYVDKRRLCEAHPFQGQARLTRSWCNGVALCRTSSLQQPFKSCR